MNSTPRTDEQINGKPCTRFEILAGDCLRNAAVPSEFARTLERELTTAQDRIKRLEEAGDAMEAWLRDERLNAVQYTVSKWRKAKEAKP
jgi:hypothetical protein